MIPPTSRKAEPMSKRSRIVHLFDPTRATRGLPPRPVHLRSLSGGNNTMCGRGGIAFSAPVTTAPAEATCKNCLKVWGAIERSRAARREAR